MPNKNHDYTSTQRVRKHRTENKKLGRERKEFTVTPDEHKALKAKLAELRANQSQ